MPISFFKSKIENYIGTGSGNTIQFNSSNKNINCGINPILNITIVGGGGGGGGDVCGGGQVVNVSNYNITGVQSLTITVSVQTDYPAGYNHFGRNGNNYYVSGGTGIFTAMGGYGGRAKS
jgi:hypothetical protein